MLNLKAGKKVYKEAMVKQIYMPLQLQCIFRIFRKNKVIFHELPLHSAEISMNSQGSISECLYLIILHYLGEFFN